MSVATESIQSFLCRLRAVKDYTAEAIDEQALESILEVGRWTGTGSNRRGTEVIVVRDPAVKKQFGEWGAACRDADTGRWLAHSTLRGGEFGRAPMPRARLSALGPRAISRAIRLTGASSRYSW